jgi:hypothetical protein
MRNTLPIGCALPALLILAGWITPALAAGATPEGIEFFEKKVRPVLVASCYKCHSTAAKKPKGGLLLDSREALLKGGDNGPALVPGQPDKSRFIEAIGYKNIDLRMPPKGKLPDAIISDLNAWVKMGAPWPRETKPRATAGRKDEFDLHKRKQEHWAWQPVRPRSLPAVRNQNWPHTPVDHFILAKLEEKGLTPAAPADKRTLLRRIYFDLIGLPPTPEEVEAFLKDLSPDALAKVVDRLLASAHFGERWARHWLDLVRYAESHGHEFDYLIPNAYQYRDYVIRAFNADVPYDQFAIEHVAGDLLLQPRLHPAEGFNESILGTGFWFLGEEVHSPVDIRQDQADRFDNRIDVMSKTFLGLTVACARCHDHKFDAISTKDYYALFGFLESSSYRLVRFDSLTHNRHIAEEIWKLREQSRPAIQRVLVEEVRPAVERLADHLLAAQAVLQGGRQEDIARGRNLDAARLGRWVAYLRDAARDEKDPFHAWAIVAADGRAKQPQRLAELLKPIVANWRKRQADAATALNGTEVVIDYGKHDPATWLPDDVTFGPGPVHLGEIRVMGDSTRLTQSLQTRSIKVFDYSAAELDRTWDGMKLAPGAEGDSGALGQAVRAGRTVRTPTFTLTTGKVFYLLKGAGQAYAAVDQHVLINGPLHAALIKGLKVGEGFQWVGHDLSNYKGQRVHVEFTAADNADLAVALVVQAEQMPGMLNRPNSLLLQLLAGSDAGSVETLAAGYQRLLTDVLDRLGSDRILGSPDATACAPLVGWLVQRQKLFMGDGSAGERLTEVVNAVLSREAQLIGQIKRESRLAPAMLDGTGQDEYVFIRGSHKAPGELVHRRFLEALRGAGRIPVTQGSGRLELARQMTDPALNPFIARVIVNRVWHHLFGRGIVASVDNFGVLGEPPTHPELLDHLADQFVKEGWSVKKLIRSLVLSRTYQMSSQPDGRADQADPQNLFLHRMHIRRLEGEAIRDAILTVSGRLDDRMYGPSVPVYLTAFQDGRGRPASGPLDGDGRRSIYLAVRRNFLSSLLLAFDTPIPFSTVGRRTVSNVPAQALILMNDPFVHQQAKTWAQRVLTQPGTPKERISRMYLSAFSRLPTEAELAACLDFLNRQSWFSMASGEHHPAGADDPAGWADLAHVLINAKEFIFLK